MSYVKMMMGKVSRNVARNSGRVLYPLRQKRIKEYLSGSIGKLTIEISNICNANCIFCAYQYQTRPQIFMDMDLFKDIVRQYVELGGTEIDFTPTVGDALTDKHFLERLRYASSFDQIEEIALTTNLISLQLHGARELIEAGLTRVSISISGLDEAMYKRVYRSKSYKKVIANLRELITVNNAMGKPLHIYVSMRCDRPIPEVAQYPDYKEIAALVGPENVDFNLHFDNWAGKIKQEDLSGTMKMRPHGGIMKGISRMRLTPCAELYDGPMVYSSGLVGACGCRDVDASKLIIGDLRKESLADIWFGEKLQKLRDEFLTDRIQPICKMCTHYYNMTVYSEKSRYDRMRHARGQPAIARPAPAAAPLPSAAQKAGALGE